MAPPEDSSDRSGRRDRPRRQARRRRTLVPLFLLFVLASAVPVLPAAIGAPHLKKQEDLVQLKNTFPSLKDAFEMATLSWLVYKFRHELDDSQVCKQINSGNYTSLDDEEIPKNPSRDDLNCYWYHHDREQGTQVMIISSTSHNFLAIVFAGTDDLRTSLTDADILMKPYGDGQNITIPDSRVRIHAGFDNAVFNRGLFQEIVRRFEFLRLTRYPHARLFTSGHSLGAADSILTAVGLTLRYQNTTTARALRGKKPPLVTSINFGCPRIGNSYWRDFVHMNPIVKRMAIWRLVLGWDLVPRLPEFMEHVGHTIQLYRNDGLESGDTNATALAYYQHYGDPDLGLAGVPFGWSAKPFIWVPGSLLSHHIGRYWEVLNEWMESSATHRSMWVKDFVPVDDNPDDDGTTPYVNVDDDFWVNPPDDDDIMAEEE